MHFMIWQTISGQRLSMGSWVMSAHGVGVISKPQACWTESARFIVLVSHVQQFEEHRSWYLPIHGGYIMHRYVELEIWQFLWRRQTTDNRRQQTKPIASPLVYACRVTISTHKIAVSKCMSYTIALQGMISKPEVIQNSHLMAKSWYPGVSPENILSSFFG